MLLLLTLGRQSHKSNALRLHPARQTPNRGSTPFWLTERSFLNNVDSSGRQGPLQPKTNKPIESTGTKTLCELGCLNLRKNVSPTCLKKRRTAHPAICYREIELSNYFCYEFGQSACSLADFCQLSGRQSSAGKKSKKC